MPIRVTARPAAHVALVAASACAIAACVDTTGLNETFGSTLVGIDVAASATSVAAGDTVLLSAKGRIGGLLGILNYDPLADATWRLSDPALGALTVLPAVPGDSAPRARARVVARRAGALTVTAAARGKVGSVTVTVLAR